MDDLHLFNIVVSPNCPEWEEGGGDPRDEQGVEDRPRPDPTRDPVEPPGAYRGYGK